MKILSLFSFHPIFLNEFQQCHYSYGNRFIELLYTHPTEIITIIEIKFFDSPELRRIIKSLEWQLRRFLNCLS